VQGVRKCILVQIEVVPAPILHYSVRAKAIRSCYYLRTGHSDLRDCGVEGRR